MNIDNPQYQNDENGNQTIWQWITQEKNTLQGKIMDSIEWCGKATVESDDSKGLLQYIISIESLLQFDEGTFISSSIVSQLSDMVAFLLGETYKQRLSYVKYIRDLYHIRSALSHGGKGNISEISLHTAFILCHKIIRKVITQKPFSEFKTKESLCRYLINLKYGTPEGQ